MTDQPVRVTWQPSALSATAARHPEVGDDEAGPWLVAALRAHAERPPELRQALDVALAEDGAMGSGEEEPVTRVYRLPAEVVHRIDRIVEADAAVGPRSRSGFVQAAALTMLAQEALRRPRGVGGL